MGGPGRWRERRNLLAEFHSAHPGGNPDWDFLFWCAGRDKDPRGLLPLPRRKSGGFELWRSLPLPQSADPRGPGWTPLHEACYLGCPVAVDALAKAHPEWVNARDRRGVAPFRALFLFNDTAPGWKHPGAFDPDRIHRALATDADIERCASALLRVGAKLRGGEFCSAAHMGLASTCSTLAGRPHAHADDIDHFFPAWAASRGLIHSRPQGCSTAVLCALEGYDPGCALSIALDAPRSMDDAHAAIFCKKELFADALAFLSNRPECAQAVIEAVCDRAHPPESAKDRQDELALAQMALDLGADARSRCLTLCGSFLSAPLSMAARNARADLIDACLRSVPASADELAELAKRSASNPFVARPRREAFLSMIERLMLDTDCAWPAAAPLLSTGAPKRL